MPDAERTRRATYFWGALWAMALLSAAYMWYVFNSGHEAVAPAAAAVAQAPDLRRVDAYRAFVDAPDVSPGLSHEYTASGIEHLADAIRAVAEAQGVDDDALAEQLSTFQQRADELRTDPGATDHADIVKEVFASAAAVLARLQRSRRLDAPVVETRIAALGELAREMDGSKPLLEQQARVRQFFKDSADALYVLGQGTAIAAAPS